MILLIYLNHKFLFSLLLIIIKQTLLGLIWEKLESDPIFRNKLKYESDLIFRNEGRGVLRKLVELVIYT